MWELDIFWWQAQCMSSCIALLSPEVRWSEMEWHVSLVLASRLSVRCEMNGLFYTSIFYRNECGGFHVRGATVCGRLFTLGTLLFRWGAVLRGIWVAGLFHLLLGRFCYFTDFFSNDIVIRPIRCFCFKKVHPCVVKSDAQAIWAKPCLLHLIVFPFFDCLAVLLYTKPQTLVTVRASRARTAQAKKKGWKILCSRKLSFNNHFWCTPMVEVCQSPTSTNSVSILP